MTKLPSAAAGAAPASATSVTLDPVAILKGIATLRRLTGTYPVGHPMVDGRVKELDELLRQHLSHASPVRIDVVHGDVHLDGVAFSAESQITTQLVQDLVALGVHSIHVSEGVTRDELLGLARYLWDLKETPSDEPFEAQLASRGVHHVSLGRLVPLDTRWRAQQWDEAPSGPIDPDYAESIMRAQATFEDVAAGKALKPATVRDLVQLLMYKVARSNAALSQILAVKQYENLTYCHSVNVSMLSLLLGREVGLDEDTLAALVEASLLHDIGKTRIPLEVVKKPGALDKHERRLMEAHTTYGGQILVQIDGLRPLTPLVALEHHRTVKGFGYPDLGDGVIPHPMSQIVSVADIYEAITGARTYQAPASPERACLILARLAGEKLNTSLVKTFVNAVTFFPIGSVVRTSLDQLAVVVRTNQNDPLHPVVVPVDDALHRMGDEIDTAQRSDEGEYRCHVLETIRPQVDTFDVREFLPAVAA